MDEIHGPGQAASRPDVWLEARAEADDGGYAIAVIATARGNGEEAAAAALANALGLLRGGVADVLNTIADAVERRTPVRRWPMGDRLLDVERLEDGRWRVELVLRKGAGPNKRVIEVTGPPDRQLARQMAALLPVPTLRVSPPELLAALASGEAPTRDGLEFRVRRV